MSYLDRNIFNNQSLLSITLNEQAFSQLSIPLQALTQVNFIEETDVDSSGNSNSTSEELVELSANRILAYDATSPKEPKWISPDAEQARIIMEAIQGDYRRLYATLGLSGEVGEEVKMESGIAKAYNFDKMNRRLACRADALEETEYKIYDMYNKFTELNVIADIDYPETFDLETEDEAVDLAERLLNLQMPMSYQKEVMRRLAVKTLPKVDKKVMDEINKDIESFEPELPINTFNFDTNQQI